MCFKGLMKKKDIITLTDYVDSVKQSINTRKYDRMLFRLSQQPKQMDDKSSFLYQDKILICGQNYIRHYSYDYSITKGTTKPLKKPLNLRNRPTTTLIPPLLSKGIDSEQRSAFSLTRTRNNLFNTISSNTTQFSKILTLTTKQPILERNQFLRYFKIFRQRFKRQFNYNLPYVGILERQLKRGLKENNIGSIHVHLVIFTDSFIPYEILKPLWSYGSIDIKKVNKQGLAKYLSKYLTKQSIGSINSLGKKAIIKSNGLKFPKIRYHLKPKQLNLKLKKVFKKKYPVYSNSSYIGTCYLTEYVII